jgi:hypothetical protein
MYNLRFRLELDEPRCALVENSCYRDSLAHPCLSEKSSNFRGKVGNGSLLTFFLHLLTSLLEAGGALVWKWGHGGWPR